MAYDGREHKSRKSSYLIQNKDVKKLWVITENVMLSNIGESNSDFEDLVDDLKRELLRINVNIVTNEEEKRLANGNHKGRVFSIDKENAISPTAIARLARNLVSRKYSSVHLVIAGLECQDLPSRKKKKIVIKY
jgi:20S proteasome alpha/beta subunit